MLLDVRADILELISGTRVGLKRLRKGCYILTKTYSIYKHTNLINGKIYIGQTCQNPAYRWGSEGQGYKNGNNHFWSAIKKYGWENFSHEILYTGLTENEANSLEISLIELYNSTNPDYGYNSNLGGNNHTPNEETKRKQSVSAQNRPIVTNDTKEKLSKVSKGRKRTEETREKIRKASLEREKNRTTFKKKVECINTGVIFDSLKDAANWCGLAGTSGIASVCKGGKQKTAGVHPNTGEKLRWRYANEIC